MFIYHIIIVCPTLATGGAEKLSVNIANYYASIGHVAEILVFSKEGQLLRQVNPDVTITSLQVKRARFAIFKLARYIRERKPDIVISMLRESNMAVGMACYFGVGKTKVVLREASGAQYFGRFAWLHQFIDSFPAKIAFRGADGVIFNSQSSKDSLKAANFLPEKLQSIVIHNPVLRDDYKQFLNDQVNHQWLISKKYKIIISCGRLDPLKEYDVLIRAFKVVYEKIPESRLLILGDGPEYNKLALLIKEIGLDGLVELTGFVENPISYFSKADTFVSSSKVESFGNAIVEAMAAGLVVVATDSGGPGEILKEGLFGKLVPVGDSNSMSEAIIDILKNNVVYPGIQERAAEFTVSAKAQQYINFAMTL